MSLETTVECGMNTRARETIGYNVVNGFKAYDFLSHTVGQMFDVLDVPLFEFQKATIENSKKELYTKAVHGLRPLPIMENGKVDLRHVRTSSVGIIREIVVYDQ